MVARKKAILTQITTHPRYSNRLSIKTNFRFPIFFLRFVIFYWLRKNCCPHLRTKSLWRIQNNDAVNTCSHLTHRCEHCWFSSEGSYRRRYPRKLRLGTTSRERSKSALCLRLKILKGGPFGLCETLVGCKIWKKLKGGLWEILKKFGKKILIMGFLKCHSAENVKGGPLGIFWHPLCFKISKQTKGRPFGGIQKTSKKVALCLKNLSEKHLDSQKVFSMFGTSVLFLFGLARFWGLVYWMYWTSVVHQVVEQMNKKVDRSRWTDETKTSHCKSRAFSSKTPTKNQVMWTRCEDC